MKLRLTFILTMLIGFSAFGQFKDNVKNPDLRFGPGDTLTLSIDSKYVGSENLVELDVRASGFDSLSVFEGTLQWDTLGLELTEVKNFGLDNFSEDNFGRPVNTNNLLTFTWTEVANNGGSVPDSTILFTLVFETIGEEDTEAEVSFADHPLNVSASDYKYLDVFVKEGSGTVTFISPLSISAEVKDPTCDNSEDGRIALSPSGASGIYSYLWNTGQETATIDNLAAGDYSFTITDSLTNLTITQIINLVSPDPIEIAFEDKSSESDSLATISASATGGIPQYKFLWSNGDTVATLVGIENGTYGLTITDSNNCEVSAEFQVDHEMSTSTSSLNLAGWAAFPNPTSGIITVTLVSEVSGDTANWRVFNVLGKVVNEGKLQKNSSRVEISLHGNVPGLYYVNVGSQTIPILLKK